MNSGEGKAISVREFYRRLDETCIRALTVNEKPVRSNTDEGEDIIIRTADNGKKYAINTETGEVVGGLGPDNKGKIIESAETSEGEVSTETTSDEEKQKKIDSVKIDFDRDNTLPGLNEEDLEELGKDDKPVLLKKNIIDKNKATHPDVKEGDYAQIIGQSLYNPDMIVPGHKDKPYFNFVSRVGIDKNTVVLLELAETKENYEIVNLHWIDDRATQQKIARGGKNKNNLNRMDQPSLPSSHAPGQEASPGYC